MLHSGATKKTHFSSIRKAREALQAQAHEIVTAYLSVIETARTEGHLDIAAESLQWLLAHIPADTDGLRVVETSVDKPAGAATDRPTINIGIAVGGVPDRPALPS